MKRALFILTALLAAITCRAGEPKPDWIDGSSMEYPREKYLVGVGQGDSRQDAEDRSRGEISKIFSTQVKVRTSLTETESNTAGAKGQTNDFQQTISDTVQTLSKKALEGVEIAENWQDSATREYYALAVLDRQKAILAVNDKLAQFDKDSVALKDQMEKAADKFPRVKASLRLLTVLKAREDLVAELRVLDPAGKAPESPVDAASVKPAAAKAVSELDVVVGLTGDSATQIKTGIVKGLNDFGLQAKSSGGGDIIVEGEVATNEQQGDGSKWRWARTTLTVTLKDGKTEKVFSQFDATDRESSADYSEAVRRTRVALAKKVSSQINEAVTTYFENQ